MRRHMGGMLGRLTGVAVVAVPLCAAVLPRPVFADGAWLDDEAVTWNTPGMALPRPSESRGSEFTDPRCAEQARPAETDADRAVTDAGWTLFAGYTGGWGVQIVRGLAGYDGMCRPVQFQAFVFVDGQFAGTMSPMEMDARSDGALSQLDFWGPDRMTVEYVRYTQQDALCCPSARSTVQYKIERTQTGPVVLRDHTSTQPTSTSAQSSPLPPPSLSPLSLSPPPSPSFLPRLKLFLMSHTT
jgi:hypothetical protein